MANRIAESARIHRTFGQFLRSLFPFYYIIIYRTISTIVREKEKDTHIYRNFEGKTSASLFDFVKPYVIIKNIWNLKRSKNISTLIEADKKERTVTKQLLNFANITKTKIWQCICLEIESYG